jgi:hypothetical protein
LSHIFISYSKKDIAFARTLRERLIAEGFDVWMDEREIAPSAAWWSEIELNIIAAGAVVVIMSPNAKASDWVEREILVAEDPEHRRPIFPVLLAGKVWSRLANLQYAALPPNLEQQQLPAEFVDGLRRVVGTPPGTIPVPAGNALPTVPINARDLARQAQAAPIPPPPPPSRPSASSPGA